MATAVKLRLPPLPSVREIVKLYKLSARKQLSQNFILDENINRKIVKAAGTIKDHYVVEVGPGPGGITRALLEKGAAHVAVVEKDKRFMPGLEILQHASKDRMTLHLGDILQFDMSNVAPATMKRDWCRGVPQITIVGNLPFSVSTPLIIKWLEQIANRNGVWQYGRVKLTLTFQREVAERIVAEMRSKQRSRLSIMCQYLCETSYRFTIPSTVFVPQPKVDSGVVTFHPRAEPLINQPFKLVEKVVRHMFHYRQKKCKRGIQTLFPPERPELLVEMIKMAGISGDTRPTCLSMEEYSSLCKAYQVICDNNPGIYEYDYRSKEMANEWRKNSRKILVDL